MKKDCRHLRLVPTVEEHKTRMEKNQKSYAAPAMSSESRARVNQMRGCFEAEIILPDGKFQYFKPNNRFWCKNKTKENKAHIFLTESYLMLQVQTIDG